MRDCVIVIRITRTSITGTSIKAHVENEQARTTLRHGFPPTLCPIVVPQTTTTSDGSYRIRILPISKPIKIDGRLDEPAWSEAEPATDFRQESPTEGAPASAKTEVRVLYDSKNLYIGIRVF